MARTSKKKTATRAPTKERKKKDPNAPKRPLSAYFYFTNSRRAAIIEENPELKGKITQVSKLLGEEWRNLTDDEKKGFQDQAQKDKKRYEKEMEEFNNKADKKDSDGSRDEDEEDDDDDDDDE